MVRELLVKLGITIIVALLIAGCLSPFMNVWAGFAGGIAIQIIFNYFYNRTVELNAFNNREQLLNDRLELITKNSITFKCPCGENTFTEVFVIGDDNIYTCEKCNQVVRLAATFTPTIITTPIDKDKQLKTLVELQQTEEIP